MSHIVFKQYAFIFSGWMVDKYDNFGTAFVVIAVTGIISVILSIVIFITATRRKNIINPSHKSQLIRNCNLLSKGNKQLLCERYFSRKLIYKYMSVIRI